MSSTSSPIPPETPPNSMASLPSPAPLVIINTPIATKLHRNNYLAWKSQIVPALYGHDLYHFLEEEPPAKLLTIDGQEKSNPLRAAWNKQDQLLLSWLRSSLSDTILGQVVSCKTSAELWTLLQQTFSATSRARDRKSTRLNSSHAQ